MIQNIKKVGVLGGSFNPPHNDHIRIAEYIKNRLSLDKFIIVPNAQPPHKNTCHVEFEHRRKMLEILTYQYEDLEISDIESDPNVPHYTIDLIDKIRNLYPKAYVFFCMGMDSLNYLDEWKNGLELHCYCNLAVVGRYGYTYEDTHSIVKEVLKERIVYDTSPDFEKYLNRKNGLCIILDNQYTDISSTRIREEFAQFYQAAGTRLKAVKDMTCLVGRYLNYSCRHLKREVIEYIIENRLYKAD